MTTPKLLTWIAADLRNRARQTRPPYSTNAIVDVCFPGTLVTGGRLPVGVHECVSRFDGITSIVYARGMSGPEQRIAIAHGLAHLIFDNVADAARPGFLGTPLVEGRADDFAAELLAPLEKVLDLMDAQPSMDEEEHEIYLDRVDEIASRFAVPAYLIDTRIREVRTVRMKVVRI